jgi:type VI secretion system secreted protein Hcp
MAVDFFLKLSDDIKGESADEKHKDEIQLLSFSWGGNQTTTVAGTGGSAAGKADLADLSIMKYMDKATAKLFGAMVSGKHIETATLSAVKSGGNGDPFLKLTLGELFITSLQISASSEIPTESVSFSYNTIKIEYSTQDEKGTLKQAGNVEYNLKANKMKS